jgi:hypothetical protein
MVWFETQLFDRCGVDPLGKLDAAVEPDLPDQPPGHASRRRKAQHDQLALAEVPAIEQFEAAPIAGQVVDERTAQLAVDLRLDLDVNDNTLESTLVQMFAPCDQIASNPRASPKVLSFALLHR